jgi:CDP-diacylglycerol--glycerol-3-phosphate 3-phosphatidyltransferase
VVTLPNLLSGVRFAAGPAMLWLGWTGLATGFVVVFALALASDAADGWVARRLHQTSELGASLDTWGDLVAWAPVPLCGWWLWPERVRPEAPFVAILVLSYATPIVVGWLKYGRLTNHHTWAGRVSNVVLATAAVVLVTGGSAWVFRAAVAVVVLGDVEELLITAVLPEWRQSVPTLWHAVRSRR